jgi:hypothetical protein
MATDLHEGVVEFRSLSSGRKSIMLGAVQVGEITPTADPRSRFPVCFRIRLPDATSGAWCPAPSDDEAQRQAAEKINDWLNAAGVRPIGRTA